MGFVLNSCLVAILASGPRWSNAECFEADMASATEIGGFPEVCRQFDYQVRNAVSVDWGLIPLLFTSISVRK